MAGQKIKNCGFCGQEKKIVAKGLCPACYSRYHRRGTPEYIKIRKPCQIDNCGRLSQAHNLCAKHLKRWQRHGHTNSTRPKGWGSAEKHPLYWIWQGRKRSEPICEEWKSFWKFVEDVGERPKSKPILRRINKKEPYSKDNFYWAESLLQPKNNESVRDKRKRYAKAWRKRNPEKVRANSIKQQFGISLDEYENIFEKQDGVCAICREPEPRYKFLAVDHCHHKGQVRGLLCSKCNPGLGLFEDSIESLKSAVRYLEKFNTLNHED